MRSPLNGRNFALGGRGKLACALGFKEARVQGVGEVAKQLCARRFYAMVGPGRSAVA